MLNAVCLHWQIGLLHLLLLFTKQSIQIPKRDLLPLLLFNALKISSVQSSNKGRRGHGRTLSCRRGASAPPASQHAKSPHGLSSYSLLQQNTESSSLPDRDQKRPPKNLGHTPLLHSEHPPVTPPCQQRGAFLQQNPNNNIPQVSRHLPVFREPETPSPWLPESQSHASEGMEMPPPNLLRTSQGGILPCLSQESCL